MRPYLVVLVLLLVLLPLPAPAGNGNVTKQADGSHTLDFTVYLGDAKTPYATALAAWKKHFVQANRLVWVATDGLLRFGKVRLGPHPGMRSRADVVITNSGHAAVSFSAPIPETQTRLGSTDKVSMYTVEDARTPMTTAHEFGHYVFALGDEYLSNLWEKDADGVVRMRTEGDKEVSYCSVPSDEKRNPQQVFPNHSSLMYDNNEPDQIQQFCAGDHKGTAWGDAERTWWWTTDQHRMHRASCWSVIARFFGAPVPTKVPQRTGNPPSEPVFQELSPEVALAVLVQNDLADAQMKQAIPAAQQAFRQLRPVGHPGLPGSATGDHAWLGTAGSRLVARYDADLLDAAARDQAVAAAGDLKVGTDPTDLEASLMALSTVMGPQALKSNKTIVLLTNGAGVTSFSEDLVRTLRKADLCVNVVALENNDSTTALQDLATRTLGTFRTVATQAKDQRAGVRADEDEAPDEGGQAAEEALGGYLVASFTGTFTPGAPQDLALPVDSLNEALGLELLSPEGGALALELRDPTGTPVDLQDPPENVEVQTFPGGIEVYVEDPAAGTWIARVDGANPAAWALDLGGVGEEMASSPLEPGAQVAWPVATRLQVTVEGEQRVMGCQVEARVTTPGGPAVMVPLFDDGDLTFHGDEMAEDGVYGNYFSGYPASGEYEVEFRIRNVDGQYTTKRIGGDGEGTPGPVGPAPPFQRLVHAVFEAGGVPAGGGTALLPPNGLALASDAPGQVILTWRDPNQGTAPTVVQRSTSFSTGYQDVATVAEGQTTFTDRLTAASEAVYYRLVARTAAGSSEPSRVGSMDLAQAALAQVGGSAVAGGTSTGGCFVATAAYGSYLEPRVQVLRDFRDEVLAPNPAGRAFIGLYERFSPPLAGWIAGRPSARAAARLALTPVVLAVERPRGAAGLVLAVALAALLLRRRAGRARRAR